ncbi:Uncharacterised protein [Mycobacteroides abscessus subsp. abscessus]|nr:Uncharacterised protein [Mycobacteroides abscessus subsp. abscessus]
MGTGAEEPPEGTTEEVGSGRAARLGSTCWAGRPIGPSPGDTAAAGTGPGAAGRRCISAARPLSPLRAGIRKGNRYEA